MRIMLECGPLGSQIGLVRQEQASNPGKREGGVVGLEQRSCGGSTAVRARQEIRGRIQGLGSRTGSHVVSAGARARPGGRNTRAILGDVQSQLDEREATGKRCASCRSPSSCVPGSSSS